MTALYSALHLLVDGVCALAMFGHFLSWKDGRFYLLIYNFCAFALQMPMGALLDILCAERPGWQENGAKRRGICHWTLLTAMAGVLCTIAGAVTHPAVLGLGNALFHVGGGVGTIEEDRKRQWQGRGLGVFVAPGALGLYLGTLLAKGGAAQAGLWAACVLMTGLCVVLIYRQRRGRAGAAARHCVGKYGIEQEDTERELVSRDNTGQEGRERNKAGGGRTSALWLAVCCFAVVILRSYIGMTVRFSWKTTLMSEVLGVLAVVFGKAAGGFLAARYGYLRIAGISLSAAAVCYLFSEALPPGIAALFLFNMTMPVTLYLLIDSFPQMPGFAFGLLTFALFLGFLPEYFGMPPAAGGNVTGSLGSVLSLLLLAAGAVKGGRHDCISD